MGLIDKIWQRLRPGAHDARQSVKGGISTAVSYRTWQSFFPQLTSYVPTTVDYTIYDAIREAVPFVDAALRRLARLCGGFSVRCTIEQTEQAANNFLRSIMVNDVLRGWGAFSYSYVSSLLQYGRACAEIVPLQSGRGVAQVVLVSVRKIKLYYRDGVLVLGEDRGGAPFIYPQQDLFVYSALNAENDSPYGVSILRSLPFTVNIINTMLNANRQNWQRQGAPAFIIVDKIPQASSLSDEQLVARTDAIKEQWNAAMRDRWEQQGVRDFIVSTQGDLEVQTAESNRSLDFVQSLRALQEQVVSTLELAPFMLGLQWSTTERLSQQQADMIIGTINAVRREIEPAYMRVMEWWQRLGGYRGELQPVWADVSLQDAVETARARQIDAIATKTALETALLAWENGMVDQRGAMAMAGIDAEPAEHRAAPVPPKQTSAERTSALAAQTWRDYPATAPQLTLISVGGDRGHKGNGKYRSD